ncbi:hypothetical protein ACFY3J_37605 [Streptomyces sp. NPDC001231]|uniref:hypothetical protein n=1 Tax=Streptomyces sp. NPDC001231 TaxID=3364549 RepID=UPI00367CDD47
MTTDHVEPAAGAECERGLGPADSLRTFGAVVQALREHAGLSRVEFGELVRLSKHTVKSPARPSPPPARQPWSPTGAGDSRCAPPVDGPGRPSISQLDYVGIDFGLSVDTPLHPRDLEQKYSTHAFFRLLYIAALRGKARDWATNIAVSVQPMSSGAKIEYHHVFPRARVQATYAKEEWNSLANLAFVTGQTNKMIGSKLPAEYMAAVAPERLAEQWIPDAPELRSLDRFPDFLAARRRLLANILNRLLGLPTYDRQVTHRDIDEPPADEEVIAEEPTAPTLAGAAVQELRTENGVEIHATYDGRRVNGYYNPSSRTVTIPSGPGRGEYDSPSGAAVALVRALNPHVNPQRNGWSFWTVTATGKLLESIR